MNTHQGGNAIIGFQIALDQCNLFGVIHQVSIRHNGEFAKFSGEGGFSFPDNQPLFFQTVGNQLRHGDVFEVVRFGKFNQIVAAGHGAVFIQNFTNHAGGF